ncbi:MAG: tetratricopeptide repeat protein [Myxococcales bacterium]|nr:tetratricopeptide repeat protein [Myxococcales bacterium]
MRVTKCLPVIVGGFLLFASVAKADVDAAREAFSAATTLFNDGDYTGAATAFRAAYDANPNWKIHYNIAQSEAAAKNYGSALEAFEAYLVSGGDDVPETRREEVEAEMTRIRNLVGFVVVTAPDGAEVYIADSLRGTTPLPGPIPVTAGRVQELRVVLQQQDLLKRPLKVNGGQSLAVDVAAPAASPSTSEQLAASQPADASSSQAPKAAVSSHPMVPTGISLMATGGAVLIVGAITGGMAMSLDSDLSADCTSEGCPPKNRDKHERMQTLALTSTILLPVGGALAVTGVALFIAGKKKSHHGERVSWQPLLQPGAAGMTLMGTF